jgi:hypothetical protein
MIVGALIPRNNKSEGLPFGSPSFFISLSRLLPECFGKFPISAGPKKAQEAPIPLAQCLLQFEALNLFGAFAFGTNTYV